MTDKVADKVTTILETNLGWQKGRDVRQVFFAQGEVEPEDVCLHEFQMDRDSWEELGSPTIITLTIESGDKLNVEEAT